MSFTIHVVVLIMPGLYVKSP